MARRTSGSLMFNQKKEQKKMKKFWNLMLAALVIIGAAACTENYEGVDVVESLSFYAEIGDDTRAYIEKDGEQWKTTFEGNETLYVNDFPFTNTTEEPSKFTCTAVGVSKLAGANVKITTDGNHHSLQGKAAFNATADVENFGAEPVKLQPLTSFFRFTYYGEGNVKISWHKDNTSFFRSEEGKALQEVELSGKNEEQFVAFWPNGEEVTLSYAVNGEVVKVTKRSFVAGMVYNLGTLAEDPVKTTVYLVPGTWASDSPNFSVYYWRGDYNNEVIMEKDDMKSGVYKADILASAEGLLFKRLNPADNSEWNKTQDLTLPTDSKDHYYVTGWNTTDGEWREYIAKEWALSGTFNGWSDTAMTRKSASISYVSGVKLTAYTDSFKVREVGSWATNYGAGYGYMVPNKYMSVAQNGGDIAVTTTGTYDIYFDEIETIIYVVSAGTDYTTATKQTEDGPAPVTGNMYYFKPNSNWNKDGAKFVAYFWDGSGSKWCELINPNGGDVYECNVGEWVPTHVIFLRKDPSGYVYNNWTCWNRIGNITVKSGNNFYTMAAGVWSQQKEDATGYTGGTWSKK